MPTLLAKDLRTDFPRSPRALLAGYVIAARTLDKCRAVLAGTAGEYHFDCPLDNGFLGFTGLSAEVFKAQVATGASDEEMAAWITANASPHTHAEIVLWNNQLRGRRICEMAEPLQLFLEDYIPKVIPANRPVYVWFDVDDIEEQRI